VRINHGEPKDSDFDDKRLLKNNNMATQTGNTHISKTLTRNIEIPTVNPGFAPMEYSRKFSAGDRDNE